MYQVSVVKGGKDVMAPMVTVPTPRNQLHSLNHPTKVLHRLPGKVIPLATVVIGSGPHSSPPDLCVRHQTSLSALFPYGIPSAVSLALPRFHKSGALHGDITLNNMILQAQADRCWRPHSTHLQVLREAIKGSLLVPPELKRQGLGQREEGVLLLPPSLAGGSGRDIRSDATNCRGSQGELLKV